MEKAAQDNTRNLLLILDLFWDNKLKLILITVITGAFSVVLALYLPDQYQAEVVISPAEDFSSSQLSGVGDSLASLAGVDVSKQAVNKIDIVLETLQSKRFVLDFVDRHDIKLPLMAGYSWDKNTDDLLLDADIYDEIENKWTFKSYGIPPQEYVYKEFMDHFSVLTDAKTGIIKLTFEFPSPTLAQQWLSWIVVDINEHQRMKDVEKSDRSIQYLQEQIQNTDIVEIRNIFFDLIQEQHKTKLLANTRDEYALAIIDPAVIPDIKSGPIRPLIVIIGVFLGFFTGMITIYFRHLYLENKGAL